MTEFGANDSVSRPWPGSEALIPLPWGEEQDDIAGYIKHNSAAGQYVTAVAIMDYVRLSDIAVPARLAFGRGSMARPPKERAANAIEYMEAIEGVKNKRLTDEIASQVFELAKEIPKADR